MRGAKVRRSRKLHKAPVASFLSILAWPLLAPDNPGPPLLFLATPCTCGRAPGSFWFLPAATPPPELGQNGADEGRAEDPDLGAGHQAEFLAEGGAAVEKSQDAGGWVAREQVDEQLVGGQGPVL